MHIFQTHMIWENGNPLAFQLFTNVNFGAESITTYRCLTYGNDIFGEAKTKCVNIRDIKSTATHTLYPNRQTSKTCTLILLSNLEEPEWIQIECDKNLLASVFCVQNKRQESVKQAFGYHEQKLVTQCPNLSVVKNNKCFMFEWHERNSTGLYAKALSLRNISSLRFIFYALTVNFPAILSPFDKNNFLLNKFSYTKILNNYEFYSETVHPDEAEGFFVFLSSTKPIIVARNVFICSFGSHISQLYICDGIADCPFDDSDEDMTFCKIKEERHYYLDHYGYLYYRDIIGKYQKFITDEERKGYNRHTFFTCKNSISLDQVFQDDLVVDCGPEAEDELVLISLLKARHMQNVNILMNYPARKGIQNATI